MNVNALSSAGGAQSFSYTATADSMLYRLCVVLVDGGISPTKFGGLSSLANGIKIQTLTSTGGEIIDWNDGEDITLNYHWTHLSGADTIITAAAGDDKLNVRWTFANGLGDPLFLSVGQEFRVTIQDNLTGLTYFKIFVQGHYGHRNEYYVR